jgi:cytochrome c oxidase subunit 2
MQNVRHFTIVAVLVALATVGIYAGLTFSGLMPVQASAQAVPIDWLFDLQIKAMSFLFSLIVVPILYSLVVFRRRPGETGEGQHFEGNTNLEIAWTIVPLVVVVYMGFIGADNLAQVRAVDPQAIEVKVVGFQWGWRFDYPQGFSSPKLYLPVNKQVNLTLESLDVLHSFWVPEFRVKQDLVPGQVHNLRITPTLIGEYKVRCAEICGASHAYMESPVVVVSQAEYDAWMNEQIAAAQAAEAAAAGKPDAGRGQKLYEEKGCKACHSLDGAPGIGPSWKGVFGEQVELADGTKVLGDEAYITESIKEPNAKIVKGYPENGMPQLGLKDSEIADIVEFIKTLTP